ncbi:MAG: response regulator, partial [Acidimicrobiia bacterium]|nr:response regulator [Acidimicrobiia bacterium]
MPAMGRCWRTMAHTLLLVEPNATIQRVVELTFAGEGVTVVAVPDGDQALERIGRERPHVVLADVAAPRRNGYEIAEHVKGLPGSPPIPVLLMAGAFERVDEQRAKEVGCDGVLVKPFEPRQLVQRVRGLLGVAAPRPAVATPPPAPPAVEPSPLDRFIAAHAAGRAAPATPSPGPQPPPSSQPADDAGARALDDYFDELDAMFAPGHGAAGAQAVPPAVPPAPPSAPTRAGAPPAPAAAFSPGPAADEIDFGFDELDAVFASASAAASPPGEMPSGWDAPIAPPESSAPPAA